MRSAAAAIVGGVALIAGAVLPWMSFFVGLRPMRGTTGPNGYVFICCGALAVAGGIAFAVTRRRWLGRALGGLGVALATFAAWLLVQLALAVRHITAHDPMMLVRYGPGLFVVLAGAVILSLVLLSRTEHSARVT